MSYIQSQMRCNTCKEEFNVAFGIQGMTLIAQHPTKCPECKSKDIEVFAEGWKETTLKDK